MNLNRRQFLGHLACAAAAIPFSRCNAQHGKDKVVSTKRPNILWFSTEDMSPDLGCYGDTYSVTPNIDKFASEAILFTNAYSHSGVCAPTRSGIITGIYPTTIGTHHMRCYGVPPAYVKCFTEYLRQAGYYCTNNSKTDYNFTNSPQADQYTNAPLTAWDETGPEAHWRNRPKDQPFFAVFNTHATSESRLWLKGRRAREHFSALGLHERHDPAKAVLPPYYPDIPEVRRDLAAYYDLITLMDKEFGEILHQLKEDGLTEDTIVWLWSDHGRGLPRGMRWTYDSGIHIALIVRVPEKFRELASLHNPGTVSDELIGSIDFAPTMLSLAGLKVPRYMQGKAFLGSTKSKPRDYIFAVHDRMTEAYELIRAVRDKRFKYIRNYMSHLPYAQEIRFAERGNTIKQLRSLNAQGRLVGPQKLYFRKTKPLEELYDTLKDPYEVNNLASDPKYKDVLHRMRSVHRDWVKQTQDVGLIPEPEFDDMKRPHGKWQTTREPVFTVASENLSGETSLVKIDCPTEGASIAYKLTPATDDTWKLYTKSISLKPGQTLIAKACRLGFLDSSEVEFKVGDKMTVANQRRSDDDMTHWMEQLGQTNLLQRLRSIKDLDASGEEAIPKYVEALNDKYGAVRYWAVIGLHNTSRTASQIENVKQLVGKLLADTSPVVRIAAAQAMCDWANEKKALPVLIEATKHKSESVRLHAVIALKNIGKKACSALPHIVVRIRDGEYIENVALETIRNLERSR